VRPDVPPGRSAQNLDRWEAIAATHWKEWGGLPDAYQTQVRR
jgi:hypothetical protein